jgi:hypothetical protein
MHGYDFNFMRLRIGPSAPSEGRSTHWPVMSYFQP